MDKHPIEEGIADVIGTYELLDRIRTRRDLVIRDDQFDHRILLEAAQISRRRKYRLKLVDTGRFDAAEVEWLIREGVHLHTSDEVRPDAGILSGFLRMCRRVRSRLAFFLYGPITAGGDKEGFSVGKLRALLEEGLDLHLTNRSGTRELPVLEEFAESSRRGKGALVYTHHGRPDPGLAGVASGGSWIHLSDRDIEEDEDIGIVLEMSAAAAAGGSRTTVHIEKGLPVGILEGLWDAGAVLLFKTQPSDAASLLRPVERKASRRRLPSRAIYLTTDILP